MCIDIVLPGLVNKEGAYRAAPELSQDLGSSFLLPSKDENSPWFQSLLGRMSVAPVNGVLLSGALMSLRWLRTLSMAGSADVQHRDNLS